MSDKTRNWLIIFFVVAGFGIIAFGGLSLVAISVLMRASESAAMPTDPTNALKVTADDMCDYFTSNELAAENRFYGSTIVSGVVSKVGTTTQGTRYVLLDAKKTLGVQCLFASAADDELFKLSSGQSISICGSRTKKTNGIIVMQKCGQVQN